MKIKKKQLLRTQSGFTLVELLLVMGLFAILLTVLTDMFVSIVDTQTESQAHAAVSEDGRYVLSRLNYDMQRASSVSTPASLGSSGSSLALVVGGTTFTYALSSGRLQLTDSQGVNSLNSSETTISALTFQRIGNVAGKDTIRASFTVTSKKQPHQGPRSETFTTTVGRR